MVNKVKCEFEISEMNEKPIFSFSSNNDDEKIVIYDENLIVPTINAIFNMKYRRLLYIIMNIDESEDATESDSEIVLLKINELKNYIINMFGKYLSKDELNKYMNMLMLLESKLPVLEERGRGR